MSETAERLASLETVAAQAAREVEQVAADRRAAERAVVSARQERVAYFETVAAGERPADPEAELSLRRAIAEAEALAGDDDLWEGQLAGRRRAAEAREREAAEFFREHFQALANDWLDEDEQARCGLQEAHDERLAAEEHYAARLSHWRRVAARYDGIDRDDLPHLPTRGEPGEARSDSGPGSSRRRRGRSCLGRSSRNREVVRGFHSEPGFGTMVRRAGCAAPGARRRPIVARAPGSAARPSSTAAVRVVGRLADQPAAPLPRCPRGHALTEANTYVDPRSLVRLCLACGRAGQQLLLDPDGEACVVCGFTAAVHRRGSFDHRFRSH